MRALTVAPGVPGSAKLEDRGDAVGDFHGVFMRVHSVGICGTDREIVAGDYGCAPPGEERLIIGHECVGRIESSAEGFEAGGWVVPIVRRPDPVPCTSCAAGEWDMCRNGRYTEHGIKELHGFLAERLRIDPHFLVKVDPALGELAVLLEPMSVVAKAWEHMEHIGRRATWMPRRVVVTGAGPIGLLAALLGRQRGLEVHLLDREVDGPKPGLSHDLGAHYSTAPVGESLRDLQPDIILECTGAASVIVDVISFNAPGCVTCLVGVSAGGRRISVDVGALNRAIVLENDVVFGSVNANRRHYELAAAALARAPRAILSSLITRRVPLAGWESALESRSGDVKTVIDLE